MTEPMWLLDWRWTLSDAHLGSSLVTATSNNHTILELALLKLCYSYSAVPGIYGSKQTESEGIAQGRGLFTLP